MTEQHIDPRLQEASRYPQGLQHPHTPIAATTNASQSPGINTSLPPQHNYPSLQESQSHFLPHTPQSAGGVHNGDDDIGADGSDTKRPRACEQCRSLKVRCESDLNSPDGPCKRCAKAGRNCIVTAPSRKRQKKTDSRVAELEKKIEALTALTAAMKQNPTPDANGLIQEPMGAPARPTPYQQVTNGSYSGNSFATPSAVEYAGFAKSEFDSKSPSVPPMVMAGQKRKAGHSDYMTASPMFPAPSKSVDSPSSRNMYTPSDTTVVPKPAQTHEYGDVVDRNIVTIDQATKMFNSYVDKMAPHFPAVVFPMGTTAGEVRKSKPTLFLAILSASSGMNYPELQRNLTKEVMSIYAERIIVNGEKTLELIQALHISTLWYWPPEHFEELKFYQLIHIAAVMAIDIGMGKRSKPQKPKFAGLWRDNPWRRTPYPEPESVEARRAWLACYFLCCNASMGLRRPNLIRWTPFMSDCVEFLETSPEAAQSDKALCQWVRSQHIAEEVGTQFSMDDPLATVNIADSKVQYALKGFERDLEKWSSQIPPEYQTADLKLTEHVVNLYTHEVAMHVDHNVEEFKPPFTEESIRSSVSERSSDKLTPAHISALSSCLMAIDGIFENFFSYDVETIRCLPIYLFVRVAYAVVVLIKMYFAAATPNSELGNVINKDNMKVEQYLDTLVDIFKASAADEKSRPSAKFLMVLIMLKTWFNRQREGKSCAPGGSTSTVLTGDQNQDMLDAANGESHRQNGKAETAQPSFSPANTPLQLLSEVATGDSQARARAGSATQYPTTNEWQQPYPASGYDMNSGMSLQQGFSNLGNIDPSLGMDLGYTMGGGFEQAIGMSLGVGDLGGFYYDNAFFGNPMGTTGDGF
ncbi:Zn2/Cys6 DNA-binding protein [Glarea lozoyensis ATCC 20868]|uniref:Zn2/Cys6 DNA-binding protein n=1 Tax=Glarea lozoyensis (strain ATCC 20868 / MF5171) TaxID=1116229 RepID=S3CQS4_GLAL2|nr:Zn2/Cys6 DNA-binding protein [Glarea lozoyensis ATCC 20868]EPE28035.1 Zn2/Cys6 DNA-binding protein [Glarea lozoyensis ATCC 20868]